MTFYHVHLYVNLCLKIDDKNTFVAMCPCESPSTWSELLGLKKSRFASSIS